MKDDPHPRRGPQSEELQNPDPSLDGGSPDSAASGDEQVSDDEFYDDEHFEPL